MLITEAQMGFNSSIDGISVLDNMQYLSESSVFAPAMVPIVENQSLQANIIPLESMTEFCESNGIVDFGGALRMVCEASEVDPSTICFSVQEENVIADQDMAELVAGIMNEGVGVVVKPLSSEDPAMVIAEATLDYAFQTGDYSLFEAYLADDYDYLTEQIFTVGNGYTVDTSTGRAFAPSGAQINLDSRKVQSLKNVKTQSAANAWFAPIKGSSNQQAGMGQVARQTRQLAKTGESNRSAQAQAQIASGNEKMASHYQDKADAARKAQSDEAEANLRATRMQLSASSPGAKPWTPAPIANVDHDAKFNEKTGKPLSDYRQTGAPANVANAEKAVDAIQQKANEQQNKDPKGFRNWCAKQIAALHNMMNRFNKEVKDAGKDAPWYKKLLSYIAKAIQWLTEKMHNAFANGQNFLDKRYDAA